MTEQEKHVTDDLVAARFTLQVSDHPEAGRRIATEAGGKSWRTVYDGPIASAREAREAVEGLARFYRHARALCGPAVGKLHYAVLRA
jgi:hypothetical protein